MTSTIIDHPEDLSRLRPGDVPPRFVHVFEPLADIVTDDWLRPYVWGCNRVSFYPHYDHSHLHKIAESSYAWRGGMVVDSAFGRVELLSATCVHRRGQWCMRWLARRVETNTNGD